MEEIIQIIIRDVLFLYQKTNARGHLKDKFKNSWNLRQADHISFLVEKMSRTMIAMAMDNS